MARAGYRAVAAGYRGGEGYDFTALPVRGESDVLAARLMDLLERVSEVDRAFFVDLFVRKSNDMAINMYRRLGYSVYRQVIGYYSGEEDAYDMRKACSRDVERKSIVPLPHAVHPDDVD